MLGANGWQIFRRLTVPHLRTYMELCVLLGSIFIVQTFDSIFIITQGGPGQATTNLPYFLYLQAFRRFEIGQAAALAIVTTIGTIIIATFALRVLSDLFKGACGANGADVIYDPVGGDYSEAALRAIAWEGRLLVVGFPAGIARLPLNLTLLKSCQIVGVFWGGFARRDPKANAANIAEVMQLYAKGAIKPRISERFPLARAGDAIARLAERKAMGKIVVTMD